MKNYRAYAKLGPQEAAKRLAADWSAAGGKAVHRGTEVIIEFSAEPAAEPLSADDRFKRLTALTEETGWNASAAYRLLKVCRWDVDAARVRIAAGETELRYLTHHTTADPKEAF